MFPISQMQVSVNQCRSVLLIYHHYRGANVGQNLIQTAQCSAAVPNTIQNTQRGSASRFQCSLPPEPLVESCNPGQYPQSQIRLSTCSSYAFRSTCDGQCCDPLQPSSFNVCSNFSTSGPIFSFNSSIISGAATPTYAPTNVLSSSLGSAFLHSLLPLMSFTRRRYQMRVHGQGSINSLSQKPGNSICYPLRSAL